MGRWLRPGSRTGRFVPRPKSWETREPREVGPDDAVGIAPAEQGVPPPGARTDAPVVGQAPLASAAVDLALVGDTLKVKAYDTRYVYALSE